jgi:hypothetical protein
MHGIRFMYNIHPEIKGYVLEKQVSRYGKSGLKTEDSAARVKNPGTIQSA